MVPEARRDKDDVDRPAPSNLRKGLVFVLFTGALVWRGAPSRERADVEVTMEIPFLFLFV
jgi:hypothetical protein